MRRILVFSIALLAVCSSVKAETFADKMANYTPSDEVVRGQNCCHPFYIAISGGWQFLSDMNDNGIAVDYDSGINANVALGWQERFGRIEFEYSKFNNEIDRVFGLNAPSGNVDVDAWMVSGYVDVPLTSRITAYGGAGIGAARTSVNSLLVAGDAYQATSDLGFAYQARAGLTASLTDRVEIFSGYRFLGTEKVTVAENFPLGIRSFGDNVYINGWESGLRFKF